MGIDSLEPSLSLREYRQRFDEGFRCRERAGGNQTSVKSLGNGSHQTSGGENVQLTELRNGY